MCTRFGLAFRVKGIVTHPVSPDPAPPQALGFWNQTPAPCKDPFEVGDGPLGLKGSRVGHLFWTLAWDTVGGRNMG